MRGPISRRQSLKALGGVMRPAATSRTLALLAVLVLASSPAPAEDYRQLVEAYVRGDRGAVDRVAQRPRSELRSEIKWLRQMRSCARCGERELADRFPFLGAALLHTERGFRDDEADQWDATRFHLELAEAFLESAPPPLRAHQAAWFNAVGLHFLWRLQVVAARRYFTDGSARFPHEAGLHIGLGAVLEVEARLSAPPDQVDSEAAKQGRRGSPHAADRPRQLVAAEAAYRRAIAVRPDSAEAHLRRGRVLIDIGRREEAERELVWVIERTPDGHLRSLAWLFRGLLEERAGHWPEAAAHHREAMRSAPPGARAAAIALAHALDRDGDTAGAQSVLDALVSRPGHLDPFDFYPFGPFRELERLLEELRAAAAALPAS
jgi:tetratricopeptide (TPR) repeat protein